MRSLQTGKTPKQAIASSSKKSGGLKEAQPASTAPLRRSMRLSAKKPQITRSRLEAAIGNHGQAAAQKRPSQVMPLIVHMNQSYPQLNPATSSSDPINVIGHVNGAAQSPGSRLNVLQEEAGLQGQIPENSAQQKEVPTKLAVPTAPPRRKKRQLPVIKTFSYKD